MDELRRTADTRPGYATYPDSRPGSPSWWRRPVDGVPPGRPHPGPVSFADWLVARHGTPMVEALDDARDRYEAEKAEVRASDFRTVYVEPEPRRRWWHRITRRRA